MDCTKLLLMKKLSKKHRSLVHEVVTDEEIAKIVSKWTGIPISKLTEAQKLLQSNSKASVPASKKLQNPLAGLVYCKKCGHLMTRLAPTSKTPYAVLKCPDRYCDNISAPIYLIEQKIISFFRLWLDNYE